MFLLAAVPAYAEFAPSVPVMPVNEIRPGMKGYMLTVLKGTEPSRIPVRIEAVIPQKPSRQYGELIMLRLLGGYKIAQGMSGSPVYIGGRLAGAVRSGWKEADHTLGMAMPAQYMTRLHNTEAYSDMPEAENLSLLTVSGLNADTPAMSDLSRKLGIPFTQGVSGSTGTFTPGESSIKPGGSIAAMLVWGDVELSVLGTVTATDRHGRFIAMGHELLKRGGVRFPSAGAYVYDIIDSSSFPFKIASALGINGTVTQDRETGLGGIFGRYPQSISCEFVFRDFDTGTEDRYKFRTAADEFIASGLIEGVCKGLAEEAWGRRGEGTMSVSIRIDGRNVPEGWVRKDIFYSDTNIIDEAFKQLKSVADAYLSQPFTGIMPSGFTVTVDATRQPKVLLIEDVKAPSDAKPGEEIEVAVKLRGWRTDPVTRKFRLTIPEDASGVVELIVRGGGTQSMSQAGIDGGWKSITSLERMLTEFRAADANNQLVLELNADRTGDFVRKVKNARKKGAKTKARVEDRPPDLLPEEEEYLSETKERRIKEGTLGIYSSEYYIDGLMRRVIHTER